MTRAPNLKPEENVKAFLSDMGKLAKKYGLTVGGCESCCGAPWVADTKEHRVLVEYVRYCKKHGVYGSKSDHENCD